MLKNTLKVIGGIGAILGLLISSFTIYDRFFKMPDYHVFTGDVLVTYFNKNNTTFLDFLSDNDARIIYLDANFESSMSIPENYRVQENCDVDLESIASGNLDGKVLPYPLDEADVDWGCGNSFVFQFLNKDPIPVTVQSMGIIMFRLKGFFEVSATSPANHRFRYTLREVDVPIDVRKAIVKKAQGQKIVQPEIR